MARRLLRPSGVHQPTTYYSHGIAVGEVVYTAGQAPHHRDGSVWDASDVEGQVRAAFANMGQVLRAAGAGFGDLARMTILVRHSHHIDVVWGVAIEFLGDHRPAVTVASVPGLADPDYLVEVDAIAVLEP